MSFVAFSSHSHYISTIFQYTILSHEIHEWLQELPDPERNHHNNHGQITSKRDNDVSRNYVTRNGTIPGGAIVMDHMLRHGMWAPIETRIFHHVILVRVYTLAHFIPHFCITVFAHNCILA
jgi:hypothetical protein